MPTDETVWESLEQWSATLFLLSSGLFFFNAIYEALQRLTPYLGETGLQNFLIYIGGLVVAVVGLFGLYRRSATWSPRLARASVFVVAIGTGSILVLVVWASTVALLDQPMPPGVLIPVTVGLTLLGMLLFGITSLRTRTPSRAIGGLLLGFVGMWIVGIVSMSPLLSGAEWLPIVILVGTGVFPLAIGYRLRPGTPSSDRPEPSSDSVAR